MRLLVEGQAKDKEELRTISKILKEFVGSFGTTVTELLAVNNWTSDREKSVEVRM